MSRIRMKTNTKLIIAVVAAVMASLFLVGALCNSFGLFAKDLGDVTLRERNEKNCIEAWSLKSQDAGDGIVVTVNDYGIVKVKGNNEGSSPIEYVYATVNLKAGEYSLWGNASGAAQSKYYIVAKDASGNVLAKANFDNLNTFNLTADTSVTISIVVMGDTVINGTFKPVLCSGTEEVSFYA